MHCARAIAATKDKNFFFSLLKQTTKLSQLNEAHALIIRSNLSNDQTIITKLIQKLLDLNATAQAKLLFASINSPDLFLYNVLIKGLRESPYESLCVYRSLCWKFQLKPDNFTYSFIIAAFSGFPSIACEKVGVLLHGLAVVSGYGSDLFVGSALVDMYASFSRMEMAYKVFDGIPEPDTVLWNTMISGLVKNCCFYESLHVFQAMTGKTTHFDSTTLAVVISGVAELQEIRTGMMVQALAMKVGCHFHDHVVNGFISLYAKCGDILTAKLLFGLIVNPDLIVYNTMISGFNCNNEIELSVHLFKELVSSRRKVSSSSVVGLIPVFYPFGHLELTCSIHGFCEKSGFLFSSSVSTALTTTYSRLNEIEFARQLFDESPEKTLASWNAMISGYAQNGETEMAISLFHEMQKLDIHPNHVTITSILSACAQLGALSLGKWVHDLIKREYLDSNIYVSTALIDMYMKCGSIEEARRLFDNMGDKNAVTYNSMITGYGLHGHGHEALKLFEKMLLSGILPTRVTFLSILYACSHAGLVEEGEEIFRSMIYDHGFEPNSEHYACMVDILGRAGKLEDALELINRMPIEPGPAEWGALLGACMIHKDANLARLASDKLFELDPNNVGYHVLLSNIYSTNHNYSQAASLRQIVKKRNLAKMPGCTLIEVRGQPHVFTSSDQSHPEAKVIYSMLENLMEKMKNAGYKMETVTALHDVEEEEKELMVKVHSEKLAIAFGLIMSDEGEEIRIIKNLRICLDCHNFTKFVSMITKRLIIVRDANRFHHFRNGSCSCGDYW
ncbi:pentatricopeptide repeat-containing protein At4g30700 [Primulina tabacum]|uniref:pentatricopeptide repeat-containing protein At4g30700 n=1 Tax=Primulina tabacum TaxID=48773 RepID=UPI003F59C7F8